MGDAYFTNEGQGGPKLSLWRSMTMKESNQQDVAPRAPSTDAAARSVTTLKPQFVVGVLVVLTLLMVALLKVLVRFHG